jgi:hypothetical protein
VAVCAAIVVGSCSSVVGGQVPLIGEESPCEAESVEMRLISAGQFADSCQVTVDEVRFMVALDRDGRIVYVGVTDAEFETPEGIRVGSTLVDVLEAGAGVPQKESGWAFHTLLPSGWRAAFTTGESLTEQAPGKQSKVRWLFRRK